MRPATQTASADDDLGRAPAYDARVVRCLWDHVWPQRRLLAVAGLLLLAGGAAQLAQPWLIKQAIDGYISQGRVAGLEGIIGAFLLALIADFALRAAQMWVLERTGQNVVFSLRVAVFSHLQRLPSAYFDRHPVGRLMTRVTSDVEAIHEAFTSGVVLMLADAIKLIGIIAILLAMDWRLALVTFAVLPPLAAASWFLGGRVRVAWRNVRRMVARLNAFLQENVSGMRVVQLFVREREARETFAAINREHRDSQMVGVRYDSIFSAFAEWSGTLTLAAIVWAGGGRILAGAMTFGTLVAFLEYAERFFRPLQELSQRYTTMQAAMAAAERIVVLLDTPPEIVSPPAAYRPARRPAGSIVFENVTFGYRPDLPVLHGVSFEVRAGESVGVVGWTGSGKSTLLRLLVRLYDVWDGRVLVDGVDVRQWDLGDLRRTVGVVPQEPFLFSGTLESNVSLGDPRVDLDTVRRAAALVRAEEFVARQSQGWATEVHERGANLSMGERQLLAFARAVALDPVILALDEATASIDPRTEHRIQEALGTARSGRTALVIAHRLATIQGADRILVLHRGRLREQGSHDELLRLEDGIYRTLFALQSAT